MRALAERVFAPIDVASMVFFRAAFGLLMAWEVGRYFRHGWITSHYVAPAFHFTYPGFGWLKPWPGDGMYVHFAVLGVAAVAVALGLAYRVSAAVFCLGFTYVFLLDQAFYLNHFYLIALLSLLFVFLPVRGAAAVDAVFRPALRLDSAPAWTLWLLRAQVAIPYFYGGVAKLNADWLHGEPMRTWLSGAHDLPLLGPRAGEQWVVLAFAYGGLLVDLLIVPFLLWSRTRAAAFAVAVAFHLLNAALFDIGVFPWLMIAATTIFFAPDWPRRCLRRKPRPAPESSASLPTAPRRHRWAVAAAAAAYLALQLVLPLRHHLLPGEVSWSEEGHRFSWHMKLRTKQAEAVFVVTDPDEGTTFRVDPRLVLTETQARKMAARPDMVHQFACYLADQLRHRGRPHVEVRAQVTASLNGRPPQPLVDPAIDLASQPRDSAPPSWILPLAQSVR